MRLKEDKTSYRSSSIIFRDNRHDHGEIVDIRRSHKNTRHWCRGKVGKRHNIHRYVESFDADYNYAWYERPRITAKCLNCGRQFYGGKETRGAYPLHIIVKYQCDCASENPYYLHNIEVRRG